MILRIVVIIVAALVVVPAGSGHDQKQRAEEGEGRSRHGRQCVMARFAPVTVKRRLPGARRG